MYKVYKYTNQINNKIYIGRTCQTYKQRAGKNGSNYKTCSRFYEAIQKYSWDSFVVETLAEVGSKDEANELEKYFIKLFNSTDESVGYNLEFGGEDSRMNELSKEKLSKKAIERYVDPSANPMFGKRHNEEAKRIMSELKMGENNPMFGTKWTEVQRNKCGTKGKTLNLSDEFRERLRDNARNLGKTTGLRPVECIEDAKTFDSCKDAADYYGVKKCTLCDCLKGRQKTCAGKHFRYI